MADPDIDTEHFRLLDLPPEIRNRIYGFCLADTQLERINLATFKTPVISRTSKQLRRESLPLFFSGGMFFLNIQCSIKTDYYRYGGLAVAEFRRASSATGMKKAGTMGIKRQIKDLLLPWRMNRLSKTRIMFGDHNIVARLHISMTQGRGQATTEEGQLMKRYVGNSQTIVDEITQKAKACADFIANKGGFCGFTMGHLEAVASYFRVSASRR